METLKFSHNWNGKLFNRAFTTFRRHNPNRYTPGMGYRIELNGNHLGDAVIRSVRTLSPAQLNDFISYLDTGYSVQEMLHILQKMYPDMEMNTPFDFCLLVYQSKVSGAPINRRRKKEAAKH